MKTSRLILIVAAICMLPMYLIAEEIPEGYYDNANGKKDAELKTALSLICRGGERYKYGTNEYHTSSKPGQWEKGDLEAYGTWQAFPVTDGREDGSVWDMYSNSVRYYPNKRGESGCAMDIEHCLPKSWWGGTYKNADTAVIYRDLFNLNPSDKQANSNKSNYAPGHVKKGDKFDNGSFRMDSKNKSQYGYICFEPAPEYRGDFARTYFYMATTYEDADWTSYPDYINSDTYLMFSTTIQQVLLDWHREDPVSDKEICRADQITSIQHNRNPFIDYPELVEYIWGNKKGQTVDLSSLTCTYGTGVCPEPATPTPDPQQYDTLINLPAITAALVNAVQGDITGSASSSTVRSNGTSSVTMGNGATDGEITFTGLNLDKDAILAFRASIYQTAESMQLDIYADNTLIKTITDQAVQNTRSEVRYRVDIPASAQSIKIISVGGSTTKRACMQELYLLSPKGQVETALPETCNTAAARKQLRDGQLYIIVNDRTYTVLGQ